MYRYSFCALALLLAIPAAAERPSFNYVEAGYQEVDLDVSGLDVDGDGWFVSGSFEIGDDWFAFIGYSDTGFDFNVDLTQLNVGLGWRTGISDSTDVFASAAYIDAEVDAPGVSGFDDSGYGVSVGIRSNVTDLIELYGAIAYSDLGDGADGTEVGGGILFNVTDAFAVGLGASTDDDVTAYGVNARFYFGN